MASSFWSQKVDPTASPQFNWQGMGYAMRGIDNGFKSLTDFGDKLKTIDQNAANRILRERMLGMENQEQMLKAMRDGSLLDGIRGRVDANVLSQVDTAIRNQALHDTNRETLLDTQDLNKNAALLGDIYRGKQLMNPAAQAQGFANLTVAPGIRANTIKEANSIGSVKGTVEEANWLKNQQQGEVASNLAATLQTLSSNLGKANALAYMAKNYGLPLEVVEQVKTKLGIQDIKPLALIDGPDYKKDFDEGLGKKIPHSLLTSLGTLSPIQGPYGSYNQFINNNPENRAETVLQQNVPTTENTATTINSAQSTSTGVTNAQVSANKPAASTKANSSDNFGNYSTYDQKPLGVLSAQEESKSNPGSISPGTGDFGGRSYGAFQFSSKQGTAQDYVKNSKYRDRFNGLEVGSEEFNKTWKTLAEEDPEGFYADQQEYAEKNFYKTTKDGLVKKGINLSDRSRAIQELLFSMGISFGGSGAVNVINKALSGKDVANLSDEEIISLTQNYIKDNVGTLYKNSPKYQKGRANRAQRELDYLQQLVASEREASQKSQSTQNFEAASELLQTVKPTRTVSGLNNRSYLPQYISSKNLGNGVLSYTDKGLNTADGSLQKFMEDYSKATGFEWSTDSNFGPNGRFFRDVLNERYKQDPKFRELLEYGNIDPSTELIVGSKGSINPVTENTPNNVNTAEGKINAVVQPITSNNAGNALMKQPQQNLIRGEKAAAEALSNSFSTKVKNGTASFNDAEFVYDAAKEGIQNQRVELARKLGIPANVLDAFTITDQGIEDTRPDLQKMKVFNNLSDYGLGKMYRFINEVMHDTNCTYQEALVSLASNLKDGDALNRLSPNSSNLYEVSWNSGGLAVDVSDAKIMAKKLKSNAYRKEVQRLKKLNKKETELDSAYTGVSSRKTATQSASTLSQDRTETRAETVLNSAAMGIFSDKLNEISKYIK